MKQFKQQSKLPPLIISHDINLHRALNYPRLPAGFQPAPGQVRASAHTDYGAITILRTDGPGLQVSKDLSPPVWVDVPYVQDGFVINLGDLMKRWTNDFFLSTLHRVVIPSVVAGDQSMTCAADDAPCEDGRIATEDVARRRQSIAFFVNVNRDARVSTLPSQLIQTFAAGKAQYEPIIAGDFLLLKHIAAQKQ